MEWDKINIQSIMTILRETERLTPSLFGEYSVVYSDGKEEIKISYKKLKETTKK